MFRARTLAALLLLSLVAAPALAYDDTATYPSVARAETPGGRVVLRAAPNPDALVRGLYYTGARMNSRGAEDGDWLSVSLGWYPDTPTTGYIPASQHYESNPEEIVCEVPVAQVREAQATLLERPAEIGRASCRERV